MGRPEKVSTDAEASTDTTTPAATLPEADVLPNQLSHVTQELTSRRNDLWRSNYHEASIYIEEGLNNDKFENHPRKRASKLVPTQIRHQQQQHHLQHHLQHHHHQHQHQQQQQQQQQQQKSTSNTINEGRQVHLDSQNNNRTLPLISCLEGRRATAVTGAEAATATEPAATTITSPSLLLGVGQSDDKLDKLDARQKGDASSPVDGTTAPKGSATFLLGGQYTTIETYILVHNRYFYQLDLAASIVLLALALVEPPAVDGYELNPSVHAAIETFALGIIAIELLLKFRWMGPRRFFGHGRTVIKLLVLLTMNLEAFVILFRHSIHARYSRALRPIFLIDNHYCHGLRRAVRQIFQSLPPIIDMFTLALFFMFVFSIFGFYMFAATNHYFSDMSSTAGNLLVLATTANLPDVMMPSYAVSRWSAIYFVLFVIIHLFLFTNLTMAAVYEVFTRKEKEKFHKLLLHRRKACQKAFKLLVSRREPNKIQYRQFMGLMRYLNQKCSMFDAYLIFKALDTDQSGSISLEEFYQIYDYINLDWKLIYPEFKWYDDCKWLPNVCRGSLALGERVVRHQFFEWTIDILIAVQAFLQFVEASTFNLSSKSAMDNQGEPPIHASNGSLMLALPGFFLANSTNNFAQFSPSPESSVYIKPDNISTFIFISVFSAEMIFRCLALGWHEYWHSRWNRFDLIVLATSICGLVSGSVGGHPFGWIIVLRILRLMRVFEFKRRYKDMWQTLTYILLKRFVSMTCVVMILYYFFAIIGMELFGDYDLRNCCIGTPLEAQFKYDNSTESMRYYLNDFGDLVASYLTLFSMSSNTYWLTTMSAYAYVSDTNWTRLFFGLYYLGSIIVMNIVIAFILESFLFHIHYRNKMGKNCDDTNLFTVSVTLSSFEVDFLRKNLRSVMDTRRLDSIVDRLAHQTSPDKGHTTSRSFLFANQQELDETASLLGHDSHHEKAFNKLKSLQSATIDRARLAKQQKMARGRLASSNTNDKFSEHSSTSSSNSSLSNQTKRPNRNTCAGDTEDGPKERRQAYAASGLSQLAHEFGPEMNGAELECRERRPEWYLIYQAEQIRNKFSFTMKMYADEVGAWLAEADQDDQDEMSLMISRNQIRAEHVAMARLARRNLAELQANSIGAPDDLIEWARPRSWSTSGSAGGRRSGQSLDVNDNHAARPRNK